MAGCFTINRNSNRGDADHRDDPPTSRGVSFASCHQPRDHSIGVVGDYVFPLFDKKLNHPFRYYLPIILLSSSIIFVVALITNNVQRRYPQFWFVPASPPEKHNAPVPETPRGEVSVIIAKMDKVAQTTLPLHHTLSQPRHA